MKQEYELLEEEIASVWGGHVVACSSGTAALHLALECLQLPPGSKVLVPDFTMVACARAVALAGLEPVFVDCRLDGNVDLEMLAHAARLSGIRAVMVVHIYGRRCDMSAIHSIAAKHNLFVLEDMAELHGIRPHPMSDAACWSFYRNKVVHGEEGGCVSFAAEANAERAKQLRCLGLDEAHTFDHLPRGHNYRLANLLARPIRESLRNYVYEVARRHRLVQAYDEAIPGRYQQPLRHSPWVYDVGTLDAQRTVEALNAINVPARRAFKPMSEQAEFRDCQRVSNDRARWLHERLVLLPLSADIQLRHVQLIVDACGFAGEA